jgi:hypothetical protein
MEAPPQIDTIGGSDLFKPFDEVYEDFARTLRESGTERHFYFSVGGDTVCLRFSGSGRIEQILPALNHLQIPPVAKPALTICIWTGSAPPVAEPERLSAPHETYLKIYRHPDADSFACYQYDLNFLAMLDVRRGLGLYWTPSASPFAYLVTGAPLLLLFHWWFGRRSKMVLHGGAVGTDRAGVLIAGRGGAGKSTACLACLNSPLRYAADDHCLAALEPAPVIYSLYNSAKLSDESLAWFPELLPSVHAGRTIEDKTVLFLQQTHPQKLIREFPLRAILVPRITGEPSTRLTPATSMEAVRALAVSTIFQLAGESAATLAFTSRLAGRVACLHLELGCDLAEIPEVILGYLDEGRTG